MASNQPQITTQTEERRTEYTEPDPKKIELAKKISQKMSSLAAQLGTAKTQAQQIHNRMHSVTSGSVLNIHTTGNSSYNRTKSSVERASAQAKQASHAARNAKTTRRMVKIEHIRKTYEDGRLVSEEVVSVDHRQLD